MRHLIGHCKIPVVITYADKELVLGLVVIKKPGRYVLHVGRSLGQNDLTHSFHYHIHISGTQVILVEQIKIHRRRYDLTFGSYDQCLIGSTELMHSLKGYLCILVLLGKVVLNVLQSLCLKLFKTHLIHYYFLQILFVFCDRYSLHKKGAQAAMAGLL